MFCPNCGSQIPDNARFCNYCGATIPTRSGQGETSAGAPQTQVQGTPAQPVPTQAQPAQPTAQTPQPAQQPFSQPTPQVTSQQPYGQAPQPTMQTPQSAQQQPAQQPTQQPYGMPEQQFGQTQQSYGQPQQPYGQPQQPYGQQPTYGQIPPQQMPPNSGTIPTAGAPGPGYAKKKSKAPIIIAIVAACVVVAFVLHSMVSSSGSNTSGGSGDSTPAVSTGSDDTSDEDATSDNNTTVNTTSWKSLPVGGKAFESSAFGSYDAPCEGALVTSTSSTVYCANSDLTKLLIRTNGSTEATEIYSTGGTMQLFDILAADDGRIYMSLRGLDTSSLEVHSLAADGSDEKVLYTESTANYGELFLVDGKLYLYSYDYEHPQSTGKLVRLEYGGASQVSWDIPGSVPYICVGKDCVWYEDGTSGDIYRMPIESDNLGEATLVGTVPSDEVLSGIYAGSQYLYVTTLDYNGNVYVTSLSDKGGEGRIQFSLDPSQVTDADYSSYEVGVIYFDACNGAVYTTVSTSADGTSGAIVRTNPDGTGSRELTTYMGSILEICPNYCFVGMIAYTDSNYSVAALATDGSVLYSIHNEYR